MKGFSTLCHSELSNKVTIYNHKKQEQVDL